MIVRPARLFLAFAFGIGCSVIFTFPSWSAGTVREHGDRRSPAATIARLNEPRERGEESMPHLVIETKRHTLTLVVPGAEPVVIKAQGAYTLKTGARSVIKKEVEPLWQASPAYFLRRGLPVPAPDAPFRSLNGALGHKALFLDGAIPLHSGPIWSDDVGGVRVSTHDMAMLFDVLPVGAKVEIR